MRQRLARLGAAALVISREAGQSEGTIRAGVGAAGALIGWRNQLVRYSSVNPTLIVTWKWATAPSWTPPRVSTT